MKSYLLRNSPSVDAQKRTAAVLSSKPATAAVLKAAGPVLYLDLDVHNDSIAVSIAPGDSTEVRRYGIIGGTHDDVLSPLDG